MAETVDSGPVASTSTVHSQPRPLACLGNLPPELKALIVLKAVEVDLEDDDDDDEDGHEGAPIVLNETDGGDDWVDEDERDGETATARHSKRKRERSDVGRGVDDNDGDDGWRDVDDDQGSHDERFRALDGHGDLIGDALDNAREQYLRDLGDALKWTALGALSLVNREFNEIATPHLWMVSSTTAVQVSSPVQV